MNKTKKIILTALFLATNIIIGRILSIRTPLITIGFSFVPLMLSAIILGPKYSTFISVMGDVLGALLFPVGSYFFGFTITAFFKGILYGLFLHQKTFNLSKKFILRLIICTTATNLLLNGLLNTFWIMIISENASNIIVPIRMLKQLIMVPIEVICIISLCKIFEERLKKWCND